MEELFVKVMNKKVMKSDREDNGIEEWIIDGAECISEDGQEEAEQLRKWKNCANLLFFQILKMKLY